MSKKIPKPRVRDYKEAVELLDRIVMRIGLHGPEVGVRGDHEALKGAKEWLNKFRPLWLRHAKPPKGGSDL